MVNIPRMIVPSGTSSSRGGSKRRGNHRRRSTVVGLAVPHEAGKITHGQRRKPQERRYFFVMFRFKKMFFPLFRAFFLGKKEMIVCFWVPFPPIFFLPPQKKMRKSGETPALRKAQVLRNTELAHRASLEKHRTCAPRKSAESANLRADI